MAGETVGAEDEMVGAVDEMVDAIIIAIDRHGTRTEDGKIEMETDAVAAIKLHYLSINFH